MPSWSGKRTRQFHLVRCIILFDDIITFLLRLFKFWICFVLVVGTFIVSYCVYLEYF